MMSFIRNRIFEFLTQNGYAENDIQNGFTPKVAGSLEHTSHMAYLLNHSKRKQRSVVITLKNAFGEVHHNLIKCILECHHVPFEIQSLVENLYKDLQISILSKSYPKPFIPIKRGVLQGDCLSPLLFNMIFNTFITSIRSQEFEQLGYKYARHLSPRHWYQFTDDAAIVTGQQYENLILLNAFTRWVSWANMIIRVDKCKILECRNRVRLLSNSFQNCERITLSFHLPRSMSHLRTRKTFQLSCEKIPRNTH